jgi:hypothetical protein
MEWYANFIIAVELSSRPTQKQIRDHFGERGRDIVIEYRDEDANVDGVQQEAV